MRITIIITLVFGLVSCQDTEDKHEVSSIAHSNESLYQLGDSISALAQQELLFNVANAMQNGGPEYAVEFCNLNAFRIVDSLSKYHQVKISRISDKNRSPGNKPSESESSLLRELEELNKKDTVLTANGSSTYYKSIRIGLSTCLKCHGPIDSIDPSTHSKIVEKYPNDKAINYQLNDFRGAWKVVL